MTKQKFIGNDENKVVEVVEIVSGLGEMLKQLKGECEEEIIETEETPGFAKARKTIDMLDYVFETDLGEHFPETAAFRFVLL